MPYVMLPVPAEHEEEMLRVVMELSLRHAVQSWNAEAVAQLQGLVPAGPWALLVRLCEAALERRAVGVGDVLSPEHPTEADVLVAIDALNDAARQIGQKVLVLLDEKPDSVEGSEVSANLVGVAPSVATLVLGAAPDNR